MSLLHSFYCWGHMGVVILSTAFFFIFGIDKWQMLAVIWAAVPLANALYFMVVPIRTLAEEEEGLSIRTLSGRSVFWILMVLMICAGASEQAVSQWASAFAESALHVSKSIGDRVRSHFLWEPPVWFLLNSARSFRWRRSCWEAPDSVW